MFSLVGLKPQLNLKNHQSAMSFKSSLQFNYEQTSKSEAICVMNWQNEVLDLLSGRSLESGIPKDIKGQIRERYSDVKLDYLLSHTNERASLALLISQLPGLSDDELTTTLRVLLSKIKLPELQWIWWIDEYTVTKPEYRIQIDFKEHSKNLLVVIREIMDIRRDIVTILGMEVLLHVGSFYIESPWCDKEVVQISKEVISTIEINDDLLAEFVDNLKDKLSSLRTSKVSQAGYKKLNLNNGLKPKLGFIDTEDKRHQWKTQNIDSVPLFKLLLDHLEGTQLKNHWWIISPTILNIMDDHEGPIKLKGVELLSLLLTKIDDDYLKLTGLTDVFYDAMSPLLSYLPKLTPTKQSCLILEKTYPVMIQLFSKTPDYKDRLIKLLNSGVYQSINTVRDNFEILPILIDQIIQIIRILEITTVKCLPRLLYTLGMIISDPFLSLHQILFEKVLDCLIVTIINGWPRISGHKYDILGMAIISYNKDEKSKIVEEKIRAIIKLLGKVCEDIDDDIKELVRNDPSLEDLFRDSSSESV